MTETARYQVQSQFDAETGRTFYWTQDTRKDVRTGNVTVQLGRAVKRAVGLEADWRAAIERLGAERAHLIYG